MPKNLGPKAPSMPTPKKGKARAVKSAFASVAPPPVPPALKKGAASKRLGATFRQPKSSSAKLGASFRSPNPARNPGVNRVSPSGTKKMGGGSRGVDRAFGFPPQSKASGVKGQGGAVARPAKWKGTAAQKVGKALGVKPLVTKGQGKETMHRVLRVGNTMHAVYRDKQGAKQGVQVHRDQNAGKGAAWSSKGSNSSIIERKGPGLTKSPGKPNVKKA